nr:rRNA-processing protein EBP2 [Cryptococcus depauperatus CBS 7841]
MAISKKEYRRQKTAVKTKELESSVQPLKSALKVDKKLKKAEISDDGLGSDDEEGDEDVSEEGMKRLMELVDVEDLNEFELAMLGRGEEDGEDEDEEEEDDGEEVDDNDDNDGEDDDEEQDNTIINEQPDEDVVSLDGLGSDISVDEDAVPRQKVTINNKPALRILTDAIRITNIAWPEHLVLTSKETADVDPNDDLQRETIFYKIALGCISQAKKLATKHGIPFTRPDDYYAEMVKSDEHMERVRTKLVEEAQTIKKSEAAKKQRDLKKFGKQIQQEKLKQREQDKKSFDERVQGLKRKRKEGMEIGEDGDEFDIAVEDAMKGRTEKLGRGTQDKSKASHMKPMPRHVRDSKYSLGGGGRRSKQNTRESTMDFGGSMSRGKGGKGLKGGPGGAKSKGRPGKSRRQAGRV